MMTLRGRYTLAAGLWKLRNNSDRGLLIHPLAEACGHGERGAHQ